MTRVMVVTLIVLAAALAAGTVIGAVRMRARKRR